jgi:UDP-N-acetylglucosamine 2-epimerase (non-hydrolysing)
MGSWIRQELPDLVVTQGDTSSTFAGSLAAFLSNVPVAHVEAGLRTFDLSRPFPEEGFRSMIGQIASLHFSPTSAARENLEREGVDSSKVFVVGNTVVDAMESMLVTNDFSDFEQPFILATAHRRENWSSEISALIESLKLVLSDRANLRLVWVAHPNPKLRELVELQLRDVPNANVLAPLPYGPFLSLLARANLVITDSGGIQEEAVSLGIPTLIARRSTERNEGIASGRAQLLFADQRNRKKQIIDLIDSPPSFHGMRSTVYGDGSASGRIRTVILDFLTKTK